MKEKIELSIIAVVIDNQKVTERFISSIRQYTKENYELILIDNGSKSKNAIDYFKKNSDKYFRFNKITDLAKAWNKGINLAEGKYIAVVNNDTVVPPKWFSILKETLNKNDKIGMVSPITYWLIKGFFEYGNLKNFDKTFSKPFKLKKFRDVVWGEFVIFNRKALEEIKGYNDIYKKLSAEDLEICFQLYSKNYEIWIDPRVFIYHQGGTSRDSNIREDKDIKTAYEENFKLFKSRWPRYTKGW